MKYYEAKIQEEKETYIWEYLPPLPQRHLPIPEDAAERLCIALVRLMEIRGGKLDFRAHEEEKAMINPTGFDLQPLRTTP